MQEYNRKKLKHATIPPLNSVNAQEPLSAQAKVKPELIQSPTLTKEKLMNALSSEIAIYKFLGDTKSIPEDDM